MQELIDRQEALKKMCETCGYCERFEKAMRSTHPDFVTDKCNNYKFLAEQPTIEAEPVRHGRWISKGEYAVCTECGGRSGTQYDGVEPIPLETQFCPNCGARMWRY